jgi:hypothetical protein
LHYTFLLVVFQHIAIRDNILPGNSLYRTPGQWKRNYDPGSFFTYFVKIFFQSVFSINFFASEDLPGHRDDPSTVNDEMGGDKDTQCQAGPVMDITHPGEGEHQLVKPDCSKEESKFEEPGDKTDQEKNPHTEIQKPSDNLHIQDLHPPSDIPAL